MEKNILCESQNWLKIRRNVHTIIIIFALCQRTAIHDYNLYKGLPPSCKISRKCADVDTTGTMYLHMEVALCMEGKMHDVCTGLVRVSSSSTGKPEC